MLGYFKYQLKGGNAFLEEVFLALTKRWHGVPNWKEIVYKMLMQFFVCTTEEQCVIINF